MKKVIDFQVVENMEDFEIAIPRSERFIGIAQDLGDLIKSLPLSNKQNDDLVHLAVKQVTEAETNAFKEGVKMASALNKYMKENKSNEK